MLPDPARRARPLGPLHARRGRDDLPDARPEGARPALGSRERQLRGRRDRADRGVRPFRPEGGGSPPDAGTRRTSPAARGSGCRFTSATRTCASATSFRGPRAKSRSRARSTDGSLLQYDFTEEQYRALIQLAAALCAVLPKIRPDAPRGADGLVRNDVLSEDEIAAFGGLVGHYHLTTSKIDPGPAFDWERVLGGVRAILPNQSVAASPP